MQSAFTEIIVALLGLIGVIVTACIGRQRSNRQKKVIELAKRELGYRADALSFHDLFSDWNDIHHELTALVEDTNIDRFLLFLAWNGELAPLWTTNIFQFRQGIQTPVSYVNFELDEDYVDRLRNTIRRGTTRLKTADLPPSAIKDVYDAEGVKDSVWFHVESSTLEGSKSKAITYCSFATHGDTPLTRAEITRCRLIVGRLKGMARSLRQSKEAEA